MLGLDQRALHDIDQELKEAVCDAVVNLTVARVSGSGPEGQTIYGGSPKRAIVSGHLLPRFDLSGQADETTDIRIAAMGMDLQIDAATREQARVSPSFSVYVRVLPDWEEITDRDLDLEIEFRVRTAVQDQIDALFRQLRQQRFGEAGVGAPNWSALTPEQRRQVRVTRDEILENVRREAYAAHGIELERGDEAHVRGIEPQAPAEVDQAPPGEQNEPEQQEARLRIDRLIQGGRSIPENLLEPARPPAKWTRVPLVLPSFSWSLHSDTQELEAPLAAYNSELRQAVADHVTNWLRSPEGIATSWRDVRIQPNHVASREAWQAYRQLAAAQPVPENVLVPKLEGLGIQIDRIVDFTDPSRASLRLTLDNGTAEASRREAQTRVDAVFNAGLSLRLPRNVHRRLQLDRVEPSYRFRNYLHYAAIGLNCGVHEEIEGGDLVLNSTWAPKFVQPRIVPREIAIPTQFGRLADETLDIGDLRVLPREYAAWIDREEARLRSEVREGLPAADADRESVRLAADIQAQRAEMRFIDRGIGLLAESQTAFRRARIEADPVQRDLLIRRAIPYRAWMLTNRSFYRRDRGDADRGWRLFQLAFVLAHVPTFASRMDEFRGYQDSLLDEDSASLLYFPTGGGKSEAFYGTLLFAMFVDRLRGKDRGVTAMIRYPLRLLTLQQGQRLLKLITHAELVRREAEAGTWPFEIGFWVGGANTPNRYYKVPAAVPLSDDPGHVDDAVLDDPRQQDDAERYREFRAAYNKIPTCPICGHDTGLRRFEAEGRTAKRLGIVCFNADCLWNVDRAARTPLPFILTDDTIYARAPSIILGTVDKLAMLGQDTRTIRQLMGMFGLARGVGPTGHLTTPRIEREFSAQLHDAGYETVFPAFRGGCRVFFDPFPSLIIQDEAHLLEESLGTFSGLFDSALESVFREVAEIAPDDLAIARRWNGDRWTGPRLPKIIAATATISNPDRQLEVLYQRRPLRFPSAGADIYTSFFASPAPPPPLNPERVALANALPQWEVPERTAPWMRLFVSLMTNGATHTVTAVAALSAFHSIITTLWRQLRDDEQRPSAIAALRAAQSQSIAAPWRQNALDRAVQGGRVADIMALVDLHRISLAYVTNKKGGDQVMDALDAAVHQRHRAGREPAMAFVSRLISGGIDMKEIQEIMELAEVHNAGRDYPAIAERLRSIVATSAISHGVDVDRFNSMFFAGLPSDIAEYIQASSRVGRTHVGFVMLVPTPQSRRDRYVVETHDIFHRFLERMIAPPAVERWAENAIRRVLASLVQMWAMLRENAAFIATPDQRKPNDAVSFEDVRVLSGMAHRDAMAFTEDLGAFVLRAIGFEGRGEAEIGRPIFDEHYRSLVHAEISRFTQHLRQIQTPMWLNEYWRDFPIFRPPMTSLRDVDEAGIIRAGAYDATATNGRLRINEDNLIRVMRAIRSQRGEVAEMDADLLEGGAQ
jgi:Helicase conserved C-terminal domain